MNLDCNMIYIERKQFEIVIQSQITESLLNFTIVIFGVVPTLISDWYPTHLYIQNYLLVMKLVSYMY